MKKISLITMLVILTLASCGKNEDIEDNTTEIVNETETESTQTNAIRGDASGDVVNNQHPETENTQTENLRT